MGTHARLVVRAVSAETGAPVAGVRVQVEEQPFRAATW
jgi:hypothetical protein